MWIESKQSPETAGNYLIYGHTHLSKLEGNSPITFKRQIMCNCINIHPQTYDNQVSLVAPAWSQKSHIAVDACLADEILELWSLGIQTTGCCCGHNLPYPVGCGFISVGDEFIQKMKELGYQVQFNRSRPGDEDQFWPKTLAYYEQYKNRNKEEYETWLKTGKVRFYLGNGKWSELQSANNTEHLPTPEINYKHSIIGFEFLKLKK